MSLKIVQSASGLLGVEDRISAIQLKRRVRIRDKTTGLIVISSVHTIGSVFRRRGALQCRGYFDNYTSGRILETTTPDQLEGQWL